MSDPQESLRNFNRTKGFFVGIDSDGCVFDTMEVKHKECRTFDEAGNSCSLDREQLDSSRLTQPFIPSSP